MATECGEGVSDPHECYSERGYGEVGSLKEKTLFSICATGYHVTVSLKVFESISGVFGRESEISHSNIIRKVKHQMVDYF